MLQKLGTDLKPAMAFLRRGFGVAQKRAIAAFAASSGFEIVAELSAAMEAAPEAALPALTLVHLTDLLARIDISAVRAVIVGSPGLLTHVLVERVVLYGRLRQRGIELIAADDPQAFASEWQANPDLQKALDISAAIDSAAIASEERAKRGDARAKTGRQHRLTYAELEPEATLMAKRLYQSSRQSGERVTLRAISAQLAAAGFSQANGKGFHPEAIRRMLKGNWPRNRAQK